MISVEDSERTIEAKSCEDCLGWHHHCKAECCKIITIEVNSNKLKSKVGYLTIRQPGLSLSDQHCYRLHGVIYSRGMLRFLKKNIIVVGNKIMYVRACNLLDGCLCKGHPNNKPDICKLLILETANIKNAKFRVTDNCLFKYKKRE